MRGIIHKGFYAEKNRMAINLRDFQDNKEYFEASCNTRATRNDCMNDKCK
jgi:hypothetical protein